MRFVVHLFGHEILAISTDADVYEDEGVDLSGGYLGSTIIDAGPTDRYMGFANGRECDDD